MPITVTHHMRYVYSAPVRFSPHVLRLSPRAAGVRIIDQVLRIDPVPARLRHATDGHGNAIVYASIPGEWTRLHLESRFEIEPLAREIRIPPDLPDLPWRFPRGDTLVACRDAGSVSGEVRAFARAIAAEARWRPGGFLDRLAATLHGRIARDTGLWSAAASPGETLATGSGACRDLALLHIAACRSLGIAARFVSGYRTDRGGTTLSAWAEAHVPGAGWIGHDPARGGRVTPGHVALCAAPDPAGTVTVEGGFHGAASSSLDFELAAATGA